MDKRQTAHLLDISVAVLVISLMILFAGCKLSQPTIPPVIPVPVTATPEPEPSATTAAAAPENATVTPPQAGAEIIATGIKHIDINRYSFSEEPITIGSGTTVVWRNNDTRRHIIIIKNPVYFKGAQLNEEGASWNYTFKAKGDYEYVEAVFGIRGNIIVK